MTPSIHDPWTWLAAAALLAVLEIVVPGYLLLGSGLSACLVGLVLLAGIGASLSPVALLVAWAALAPLVWLLLARGFGRRARRRGDRRDINDFTNSP